MKKNIEKNKVKEEERKQVSTVVRASFVLVIIFFLGILSVSICLANTCGGSVKCYCGDTVTQNTILTQNLNGTGSPGPCYQNGLLVGASNIIINCAGYTIPGDGAGNDVGIEINNGWNNITIKNCKITKFWKVIDLNNAGLVNIINNTLDDSGQGSNDAEGVYITYASNLIIQFNEIKNFKSNGIHFSSTSSTNNFLIQFNKIMNNKNGITLGSSSGGRINNNTIQNNSQYGIYFPYITSVVINYNRICGNPGSDLYLNNLFEFQCNSNMFNEGRNSPSTCGRSKIPCSSCDINTCIQTSTVLCSEYCQGTGSNFPSNLPNWCNVMPLVSQYGGINCNGKPQGYAICVGNKLYDCSGCGGNHFIDCTASGKICSNGVCITQTPPPDLSPKAEFGTNPVNNYNNLISHTVTFDLKCSDDKKVKSLQLYGNWSGTWQQEYAPQNNPMNNTWYNLTVNSIPSGTWKWAVRCTDNNNPNQVDWTNTNRTLVITQTSPPQTCDYINLSNEIHSCGQNDSICPEDFINNGISPVCPDNQNDPCYDYDCAGSSGQILPGPFYLINPANNSQTNMTPAFTWSASFAKDNYTLLIYNRTGTRIYSNPSIFSEQFDLPNGILQQNKQYFWRVTAFNQNRQTIASNAPFTFNTSSNQPQQYDCNITNASIIPFCTDNGRCQTNDTIQMNITVQNVSRCINVSKMVMDYFNDANPDSCKPYLKNDPRIKPVNPTGTNYFLGNWTVIVSRECAGKTVTLNQAHLFNTTKEIGLKSSDDSFGGFIFSTDMTPYLLESIEVKPETVNLNISGDKVQLKVNATFKWQSNNSLFYKDVTYDSNTVYQSNNTAVATVNATGSVAGVNPGTAKITVDHYYLSDPKEDYSIIYVSLKTSPWIRYIQLVLDKYLIPINGLTNYTVLGIWSNQTISNITRQSTVTSQNPNIARVITTTFKINGTGQGSTFINASYQQSSVNLTDSKPIIVQGTGSGSCTPCTIPTTQCDTCESGSGTRYCKNNGSNVGKWLPQNCTQYPTDCCRNLPGYSCDKTGGINYGKCQRTATVENCNKIGKLSITSCHNYVGCYWDKPEGLPDLPDTFCKYCYNDQGPDSCSDYDNETTCRLDPDRCGVAYSPSCSGDSCYCAWTTGQCIQRVERNGPNPGVCCAYNVSYGTCDQGCSGQENSRQKTMACVGPCDGMACGAENGFYENCSLTGPTGTTTDCIACSFRTNKFPFFMPWQILIVLAILAAYYMFIFKKKSKEHIN